MIESTKLTNIEGSSIILSDCGSDDDNNNKSETTLSWMNFLDDEGVREENSDVDFLNWQCYVEEKASKDSSSSRNKNEEMRDVDDGDKKEKAPIDWSIFIDVITKTFGKDASSIMEITKKKSDQPKQQSKNIKEAKKVVKSLQVKPMIGKEVQSEMIPKNQLPKNEEQIIKPKIVKKPNPPSLKEIPLAPPTPSLSPLPPPPPLPPQEIPPPNNDVTGKDASADMDCRGDDEEEVLNLEGDDVLNINMGKESEDEENEEDAYDVKSGNIKKWKKNDKGDGKNHKGHQTNPKINAANKKKKGIVDNEKKRKIEDVKILSTESTYKPAVQKKRKQNLTRVKISDLDGFEYVEQNSTNQTSFITKIKEGKKNKYLENVKITRINEVNQLLTGGAEANGIFRSNVDFSSFQESSVESGFKGVVNKLATQKSLLRGVLINEITESTKTFFFALLREILSHSKEFNFSRCFFFVQTDIHLLLECCKLFEEFKFEHIEHLTVSKRALTNSFVGEKRNLGKVGEIENFESIFESSHTTVHIFRNKEAKIKYKHQRSPDFIFDNSNEKNAMHPYIFDIATTLLPPIETKKKGDSDIKEGDLEPKSEWVTTVSTQVNGELRDTHFINENFLCFNLFEDEMNKKRMLQVMNSEMYSKSLAKWDMVNVPRVIAESPLGN